jgi:O-methyltransferase involved in polyketide biosynthesis
MRDPAGSTVERNDHRFAGDADHADGEVIGRFQVRSGGLAGDGPSGSQQGDGIAPGLAGVSETMLWALHNRASEARRPDGILRDDDSVRIHEAIDYDFARRFGDPAGTLAARAAEIDRALRVWLQHHPDGFVVSLGEGLETQARRVDNGRMRWLSVDLPDAIRLRERFLAPTDRLRHIAVSALDPAWMDAVDPSSGVFIVAQGLLMYLDPATVQQLFTAIADRFPGVEMVFDVVPRWFSSLTLRGLHQTPHYRLPPMPWGINRNEVGPTLRRWVPGLGDVTFLDYAAPRGLQHVFARVARHLPFVRDEVPSLLYINTVTDSSAISNTDIPGPIAPDAAFNVITETRTLQMKQINEGAAGASGIGDALAMVSRNVSTGSDLAISASQIIARRVALGIAGALDPLRADHTELERIVPEKVEAFSAAGIILLEQSGQANRHMTRLASDAAMTAARATIAMAGCANPMALIQAQGVFALEWINRATSSFIAMGVLALTAQEAAMVPIQQTVASNTERLGR